MPRVKKPYDPREDATSFSPSRDRYLYAHYGIGDKEYDRLLVEQGYVCLICLSPHHPERPLVVDHNHVTGKVRGLLCSECNTGIGLLGDSPTHLRAAANYLDKEGNYSGSIPISPSKSVMPKEAQ
jgi:hypothetical protein